MNFYIANPAVLPHYAGYTRACSKMDGPINVEMQEYIVQKLVESLFKFRFDYSI